MQTLSCDGIAVDNSADLQAWQRFVHGWTKEETIWTDLESRDQASGGLLLADWVSVSQTLNGRIRTCEIMRSTYPTSFPQKELV